jgi:pimeloyl-ACP methyl ester carboxylesterase
MSTVRSTDGTVIAFDTVGSGPPLILVDGALCYREMGGSGPLAELLSDRFTVYRYDRRGRGESGGGASDVERELEDIQALVRHAGGSAYLYGISSGAALALAAAKADPGIERLAVYEAPFIVDDSRPSTPPDFVPRLNEMLAADRRGDAVRHFMRLVGVPGPIVHLMRLMPAWTKMKAVAHTLPNDLGALAGTQDGRPLPAGRFDGVTIPTLTIVGGKSPAWFHRGMEALADTLPDAEHRVLDGQNHMVKPKALAPLLLEFFAAGDGRPAEKVPV